MDYKWLWMQLKKLLIGMTYKEGFRGQAFEVLRQMDALEFDYFGKAKRIKGSKKGDGLNGKR